MFDHFRESACFIAVDIGGTKIASGVVAAVEPTSILFRQTRPTRAKEGADIVLSEVLVAVKDAIASARAKGLDPIAIGIGAPGVVDPKAGRIVYAGPTMPGWAGTDLSATIREATGLPVAIQNDVRVMGLGEATFGAGRNFTEVLFVSIGTGIGGAIIRDGLLQDSPHHSRGEIAYAPCPDPQGRYSTLEEVGAGPKLSVAYCRAQGLSPEALALPAVMERYHAGDRLAVEVITERMYCVGRGLAGLLAALDADAVILGGGVGTLGTVIEEPLRRGLSENLLPALADIPLVVANLRTDAPLVGAAVLAAQAVRDNG
ncbi:hypothetical protein CAQU_07650 [Corynebacterium aquilae DSM 44791]|uniref:Glucokinase n=1 Tax=Corynebacterium aquilae DSM 44791 TaxID=1431546 RepID=A0A1L7CGL4_9CORY|nr:hypothetical protein CAQU_07650 [Corynebacterium aquilae DSM 44791]